MFSLAKSTVFFVAALSASTLAAPLMPQSATVCGDLAGLSTKVGEILGPLLTDPTSLNETVVAGISADLGRTVDDTLDDISSVNGLTLGGTTDDVAGLVAQIVQTTCTALQGLQGANAQLGAGTKNLLAKTDVTLAKLSQGVDAIVSAVLSPPAQTSGSAPALPPAKSGCSYTDALAELLNTSGTADLLRRLGLNLTMQSSGL
ncbi:hypothetical protein K488DRAFT_86635 [Vararia minispora EC-137]|uniref:Uncharacterized protein n=1 Tax=Vararia minispora EC-137 TaxID=1314806 RepID=A0ACB8QJ26_9AGAM|nr:hypothetical protein K488DRAFT_86635 [Vararia minispora EC-137]